ncbi:MAG: PAS domain S-box protein [Holophagales bacterium]|nr:PAS domain S-box protein [Holophagales bacterium]
MSIRKQLAGTQVLTQSMTGNDTAARKEPPFSPLPSARSREKNDLIARAFFAADVRQGIVELRPNDLRLLAISPATAELMGWDPSEADGALLSELAPDLLDLWLESCFDAWRLDAPASVRYLDPRTTPPRRLEFTVTAISDGDSRDPRHLCAFRIEEVIEPHLARLERLDSPEAPADEAVQLLHLVETIPALIWTADAEGQRDYCNKTWRAFTGREEQGESWVASVHPDDAERYLDAFSEAFHARESFRIELRLRRHDGRFRWMLDQGMPRFRSDGRFLGYVGSCTDISDRRRAEDLLEHSERWHREIIDGTDNLVIQLDREGRLGFVNPVSRQILGAEPEECVGFPFLDFVHGDDRERTSRQLERWWSKSGDRVSFENRLVSRTGESHDLLWTINVHRNEDGKATGINGIAQDITERKRAERVHKIQSQVLESMVEGVTLTNGEGFILYTNTALDHMFGYGPGELVGQPESVLHGVPVAGEEEVRRELAEHGTYRGGFAHRAQDGRRIDTELRISALEIDGSSHWVTVFADITEKLLAEQERQRLDQRVQQAQKLESLGILAGGIAHDFNNLLMVILGNASLAIQDLDPGTSAHSDVEQIEAAAIRAADLTKQMLAYSGKGQFLVEPSRLSVVIEEMTHLLDSSTSKNIHLRLELDPELPLVECDVSQIRQVVMNLTTNASESLGTEEGTITVRTYSRRCSRTELEQIFLADELPEGTYAAIEVIDDGPGMDTETLERIFDPFFTTKFTGRGLGLAAVLGIVRGHCGGIQIESQPGRGASFTVLLPVVDAAEPKPLPAAESPEMEAVGTVLVVDDDEAVREMAVRMLERLGFDVIFASGGEEAVEIFRLRHREIVVVLLDMTMPRMDGEATFRELREIQPDARVVLSSGYNEQIAAERFEGEGLAAFLQKPYRQTDLILTLDKVLDLRS